MLDYLNNLNRKRRISQRHIVCLAISCFLHFCLILTFSLFPGLLAAGYHHGFRGFQWGTAAGDEDMERWRMVAILEPPSRMNMPSSETLRKSLGLGDKEEGAGSPPIDIRFGSPEALETDKPPLPQVPPEIEEPEVLIPNARRPGDDDETKPDAGSQSESPDDEPAELGTGREIFAAKPEAGSKVEVVADATPLSIPDGIQTPEPPSATKAAAGKSDIAKPPAANEIGGGSGAELFDTAGFPMGEYREIIRELVRSRWSRPSNVKGSQRRATVVFYIDRNGRVDGLYVEVSSGNQSLDSAALSAIWGAPFPPLPKDFPRENVGVRLVMIDN